MRLIHFSDLHLGVSFRNLRGKNVKSFVNDNILRSVEEVCKYAINHNVDLILVSGDIFNRVSEYNFYSKKLVSKFRVLYDNSVPVIMIGGNHDYPNIRGLHSPFSLFGELGFTGIFYFEGLSNKPLKLVIDGLDVGILPIPYISIRDYRYVNRRFESYISELYTDMKNCDVKIMVTHYDVKGARYSSFDPYSTSYYALYRLSPQAFKPDLFDYIALGHIHLHQNIPGYNNMFYSGSLERVNFGEVVEDKGFLVVDIDGSKPMVDFVSVSPVKMVSTSVFEIGASNPVGEIISYLDSIDIESSLLRIRVKGDVSVKRRMRELQFSLDDYLFGSRGIIGYRIDFEEFMMKAELGKIDIVRSDKWLKEMIVRYIDSLSGLNSDDRVRMKKFLSYIMGEVSEVENESKVEKT